MNEHKVDIIIGIESCEMEGSVTEVQGYKWLGKPRKIYSKSTTREGGVHVGFLIQVLVS